MRTERSRSGFRGVGISYIRRNGRETASIAGYKWELGDDGSNDHRFVMVAVARQIETLRAEWLASRRRLEACPIKCAIPTAETVQFQPLMARATKLYGAVARLFLLNGKMRRTSAMVWPRSAANWA
jgi:hypothetical protein